MDENPYEPPGNSDERNRGYVLLACIVFVLAAKFILDAIYWPFIEIRFAITPNEFSTTPIWKTVAESAVSCVFAAVSLYAGLCFLRGRRLVIAGVLACMTLAGIAITILNSRWF